MPRSPALTQPALAALIAVALEFEAGHGAKDAEDCGVAPEGHGVRFMAALEQGIRALQGKRSKAYAQPVLNTGAPRQPAYPTPLPYGGIQLD